MIAMKMVYSSARVFLLTLIGTLELTQGLPQCNNSMNTSIALNNEGVFSLVQGAGRVEICYCNDKDLCSWQTVSTGFLMTPFSWKNSIVVCRELGYFDVQSPILQNTVPDSSHANSSVGIFPITFLCDGTESSLIKCTIGERIDFQSHKFDAYVNCQTAAVDKKVRLVGGGASSPNEGVIQYYSTAIGTWSTVCTDYWRTIEANVFCKSLGFESGIAKSYPRSSLPKPAISAISCRSGQAFISSCIITQSSVCADSSVLAGAECTSFNFADGSVRLYSISDSSTFKRVEVYYAGRWGTVCDTVYTIDTAQVTCRELGFTPSLSEVPAFFQFDPIADSSRPIWIRGYNCDGSEGSLNSCPRPAFPVGFPSTACTHSEDAGVYCAYAPKKLSGGEIAAIAISVILIVGTVIFVAVLHDKHKKGELQPWYRRKKAAFLAWYQPWRDRFRAYCFCCHSSSESRRRTEETSRLVVPQSQSPSPALQQPPLLVQSRVQPQQPQSHELMPPAPPTYDDAIHQQHVLPPPPQYTEEKHHQ